MTRSLSLPVLYLRPAKGVWRTLWSSVPLWWDCRENIHQRDTEFAQRTTATSSHQGHTNRSLWLGPGCRRVQAPIEKHLHFDASILCASAGGTVVGDSFGLAVTHRGHKTSERNLMIYRQVLNHCFRACTAQPEILCFTAS